MKGNGIDDAANSTSLATRVADTVTKMILDGRLRAGDRVKINALAKEADVSLVPVREALARLGATGVLRFVPNHGYSVAPRLSDGQRRSLFEAREKIEVAAAELSVVRRTDGQLRTLVRINESIRRLAAGTTRHPQRSFFKLNTEFHTSYLSMSQNEYLIRAYSSLEFDMLISRDDDQRDIDYRRLADEHEELIAALQGRHTERVASLISSHIRAAL